MIASIPGTFSDPDFNPYPPDSGYPVDSDLHQMSDDGGPVGPDPARWSDLNDAVAA